MNVLNIPGYFFFLFIFYFNLTKKAISVEITLFEVPKMAIIGHSYELRCSINSQSGILATIKWYKNNTEFYRKEFKPNKVKFFNTKGIKINKEKTMNGSLLVIDDVNYDSGGIYKCEVTEESSFNTDEKESEMLVTNMQSSSFEFSFVYKTAKIGFLFLPILALLSTY